tara:strand:- start:504 stop:818 length:315 start_codon:yes stop_codon:yes gene_type:complete
MSKDKCGYNLDDLVVDACESFDNDYDWGEDGDNYDAEDIMHEVADNSVPIYYYDIGQYAAHNSWLMTEKPETNSEGNAHDQIQANIYEYVLNGLYEHKQESEDD